MGWSEFKGQANMDCGQVSRLRPWFSSVKWGQLSHRVVVNGTIAMKALGNRHVVVSGRTSGSRRASTRVRGPGAGTQSDFSSRQGR